MKVPSFMEIFFLTFEGKMRSLGGCSFGEISSRENDQ
jgi:hypothetical protein